MIENLDRYIGKCIAIVDGKVVASSVDIKEVMRIINEQYADKVVTLSSVPDPKYIFIGGV